MRIVGCIWPEGIARQVLQRHNIEPDEVDEVLTGRPHFRFVEESFRRGEAVYVALGQTETGRYLAVFFTLTPDERARILWARDMRRSERMKYEQA
ncbi:MAG: BrnT family toxin [Anaerolineae bacterium]